MRYSEIQPKPPLNRFVECFWTLDYDAVQAPHQEARPPECILPDGCVELILNFGAPFREVKEDGKEEQQPLHFLVGQMTRPMLIAPSGQAQLLGIRFHPGGTVPFLRNPMHEVTNQVVELESLDDGNDIKRDLVAGVVDVPSLPQKIAAAETWLIKRLCDCESDSGFVDLAANILRLGGRITLDQLAADAGMSGRHLERRFLRDVGIRPKLFCRILRFQQVFRALEQDSTGWAGVAVDCGYYDQAHLIRDFQQFARQTPTVLLAHTGSLTESFTRKNRMSNFSNTSA